MTIGGERPRRAHSGIDPCAPSRPGAPWTRLRPADGLDTLVCADARSRNSLESTPRSRCDRLLARLGGERRQQGARGGGAGPSAAAPESSGGLRLRPLLRCRPAGRRGARALGAGYPSFNAFFTRRLREGARPVADEAAVVAPSDGLLRSIDRIERGTTITAKGHAYTIGELLADEDEPPSASSAATRPPSISTRATTTACTAPATRRFAASRGPRAPAAGDRRVRWRASPGSSPQRAPHPPPRHDHGAPWPSSWSRRSASAT
jgi:hypothetical protein